MRTSEGGSLSERRAKVFKALGHPCRMVLVEALLDGERCVCELQPLTGVETPTVSKHLAVLREAGVVTMRKEGANVYYRLRLVCVRGFLTCVDAHLRAEASAQLEQLESREGQAPLGDFRN